MNKKILKRRIHFLTQPFSNYAMKANYRHAARYATYYEKLSVRKQTIFYESRDGSSMTDSPYAMFKHMLRDPYFKKYTHIWSIQDPKALSYVMSKYQHYSNVIFVKRNSRDYLKYLATSEYLINNSTFQPFFTPKKEQLYINTWHGTPLKSMGFDIPGNPALSQNVIRNFLNTNYLLSPNAHTTRIFTESYKLSGVYAGKIIEEGYPRIDLTLKTDRNRYQRLLVDLGLEVDPDKENILYAPTWKGTDVAKVTNDVLQIIADLKFLEDNVGEKYNLLIKVHPFLYKQALKYDELKKNLIPDFVDPNELLAATDILITDYSSIFFDFLVTGRPILFYTWDADAYAEERGQYIPTQALPGPPLYTVKELVDAIEQIDSVSETYASNYKSMQETFTKYDDGEVSQRIVDNIFKQADRPLNIIDKLNQKKEKILIYPGGMRNNGITSSFINLMNNIDFEKYDVSCFMATPGSEEILRNIAKVNPHVRFLFKPGVSLYSLFENYEDKFIHNRGRRGTLGEKFFPLKAYKREHKRLFGHAKFDYVIDFSGYSLFWAKYLIVADAKKKICYMHNDLLADSERTIDGRRPHRINLRGLFSVYNEFDKLVSVSKGTMALNKKNLHEYADDDKFDYIMNSIDPEKILKPTPQEDMPVTADDAKTGNTYIIEDFKSRAALIAPEAFPVWNILPGNGGAQSELVEDSERVGGSERGQAVDGQSERLKSEGENSKRTQSKTATSETLNYSHFINAEIHITRKATLGEEAYYKFRYENRMMGWIREEAVDLLPDVIISEKSVDKLALIARSVGYDIWTKPYNIEGSEKVSKSTDYKNMVVAVDREAETEQGVYSRISIKDTTLGWIHTSALTVYESCTLTDNTRPFTEMKIGILRDGLLFFNYKKYQSTISNLHGRTLKEITVTEPMVATISNPGELTVWNKAYPNYNVKPVARAAEYEGKIVEIKTISETIEGTFYQFSNENRHIGWLNAQAFHLITDPVVIKETDVSKHARLHLGPQEVIWSAPYGLEGAKPLDIDIKALNGSLVTIDKEIITQKGAFSRIKKMDGDGIESVDGGFGIGGDGSGVGEHGSGIGGDGGKKPGTGVHSESAEFEKVANSGKSIDDGNIINESDASQTRDGEPEKVGSASQTDGGELEKEGSTSQTKGGELEKEGSTSQTDGGELEKEGDRILGWVHTYALKTIETSGIQVGAEFIPYPNENDINFVNMGRLSPEKAHDNLIQAFALFHRQHPNSKLYILGDGPLKDYLKKIIRELDVTDSVHLMGQMENPFPFMSRCDGFVLSSHYEGQPMVLLEALTLGMKIIATDIVANRTVLEDGRYGLLVENSINGLEKGLKTLAEAGDTIPQGNFDYKEYNMEAMQTFYDCLS